MPKPKFSVIVPCYNEERAILGTINSLDNSLRDAGPYELIVVDDGSSDSSPEILRNAERENEGLRVIFHQENRGYGAALKSGIRSSSTDTIVILDADGTYPDERIVDLLEVAKKADMVVGSRTGEDVSYPLIRNMPKLFLRFYASWLAGQSIPDLNSGMRVLRRSIVEKFLTILPNGFSFTTTITLAMLTNYYNVRYVPISYARRIGKSKIRPIRDTLAFLQLIVRTGMYFAPLRVFSPIIAALGLTFLISFVYDTLWLRNLTDKTLILLMFTLNAGFFALIADMIDKRNSR